LYVHVLDHSAQGAPARMNRPLKEGQADLIAFARPFIANPDLVIRMRTDATLNAADAASFYTPGAKGYTDYPTVAA
jgi:N-ethylmaleimide reductase